MLPHCPAAQAFSAAPRWCAKRDLISPSSKRSSNSTAKLRSGRFCTCARIHRQQADIGFVQAHSGKDIDHILTHHRLVDDLADGRILGLVRQFFLLASRLVSITLMACIKATSSRSALASSSVQHRPKGLAQRQGVVAKALLCHRARHRAVRAVGPAHGRHRL